MSNICTLKGGTAYGTEQVCEISSHSYDVVAHCFQSKLNEPQVPNNFIKWSLTLPAGPERFVFSNFYSEVFEKVYFPSNVIVH